MPKIQELFMKPVFVLAKEQSFTQLIFGLFNLRLTLIGTGGVFNTPYRKSALRPSKWPPNDLKFRDFSDLSEKQKNIFGFHSI